MALLYYGDFCAIGATHTARHDAKGAAAGRSSRRRRNATRRDSDNGVNGIWREPINPM